MPIRRFAAAMIPAVVLAVGISACGGDDAAEDLSSADGPTTTTGSTEPSEATEATEPTGPSDDGLVGDRPEEQFPAVIEVAPTSNGDGTWDFAVTMTSPYDSPERYADGWRVVGPDGTVFGTHTLAHDHAAEQPFTRTQSNVEIPDGVTEVTVEGRDQVNGFGGPTQTVVLDRG